MIAIYQKTTSADTHVLHKKYAGDAGMDITSDETVLINAGSQKNIRTGLFVAIPNGYFGMIKSRSGLSIKHDVEAGNAGVIDSGYRGEIIVKLYNHGATEYQVHRGNRIAQLLILPVIDVEVVTCENLPDSFDNRGENGFGSTGK